MRLFCLLCWVIVFLSSGAKAQNSADFIQSVGLELGGHHGNRRIAGGAGITFRELERQDSLERGTGGISLGVLYERQAEKIGFTTGVRYLETGYTIAEQSLGGMPGRSFRDAVQAKYLGIPFEVNFYQNITDKDRVSFTLGVAAQLHLQTTRERTFIENGTVLQTTEITAPPDAPFRSPLVSFNAGMAFDRKLSENWTVKIQPNFRFFLQGNLQNQRNSFNRNYYQLGVRAVIKRLL